MWVKEEGEYLGLELDVRVHPELLVPRRARVAELKHHLPEQDSARIHVRHRDHILYMRIHAHISLPPTLLASKAHAPPSSGLPLRITRFSPSMIVLTELPRNLLLGRSSPMIVTWFAGEV